MRYSSKAIAFLRELAKTNKKATLTDQITGDADYLIVYGPTSAAAQAAIAQYKHWVALDLGYWDRVRSDYPMRVAINATHPDGHLDDYGPERWDARGVDLGDDYKASGHVLVAGTGRKHIRNNGGADWDQEAVTRARRHFGARVRYRPKPNNRFENLKRPISEDLRGAAYVITHHSNVGIDAIIQGVPVATEEGAARGLYSNSLDAPPATPEQRLDFLRRLAWWNWKRSEIPQFWSFITERMRERM